MGDHSLFADFSTEELEAEIRRRKAYRPTIQADIQWGKIINYISSVINQLKMGESLPKDFEHQLMVLCIETIYGADVWEWWNEKVLSQR